MAGTKRWRYGATEDGLAVVTLSSWKWYADYIKKVLIEYPSYIFRGHAREEWDLISTLDRTLVDLTYYQQKSERKRHLKDFQLASRGRRGPAPSRVKDENEWWSLGQHHGLLTPLLDWTESPFVALYFAFEQDGHKESKHRVVYGLFETSIVGKCDELKTEYDRKKREHDFLSLPITFSSAELGKASLGRELGTGLGTPNRTVGPPPIPPSTVDVIRPLSDENANLVSQRGLFVRSPDGLSIDKWVRKNFPGNNGFHLLKIKIPNRDRENCLKFLNRMNINRLSLFPDLYGASRYCNMKLQIKRY